MKKSVPLSKTLQALQASIAGIISQKPDSQTTLTTRGSCLRLLLGEGPRATLIKIEDLGQPGEVVSCVIHDRDSRGLATDARNMVAGPMALIAGLNSLIKTQIAEIGPKAEEIFTAVRS